MATQATRSLKKQLILILGPGLVHAGTYREFIPLTRVVHTNDILAQTATVVILLNLRREFMSKIEIEGFMIAKNTASSSPLCVPLVRLYRSHLNMPVKAYRWAESMPSLRSLP